MIKLIVFDIDGVITDGTYIIDSYGNESKIISFKDLDSFSMIKSLGVKTMLLTSEKNKLTNYFNQKFKPDIFFDGAVDKFEVLNNYLIKNSINFSETCYVGDGKKDIKCIESCGLSICPSNSIDEIKKKSSIILNTIGGSGVIYSVYKIISKILDINENADMQQTSLFCKILNDHIKIIQDIQNQSNIIDNIYKAAHIIKESLKNNGVVFSCGNGGSASDSQHFVAELISKFKHERRSIPAISLTTNTSIITSIGNDYSFDNIFARQIEGLARSNDVLVAITTSGSSNNIKLAMAEAKKKNMKVIVLTSEKYIENNDDDVVIKIPSFTTARIQEFHIMVIHCICEIIEKEYINNEK